MFKYFRPFFFALSITFAIYIAIEELHKYQNANNFYIFSLAVLGIYFIELFISWQSKSSKLVLNFDLKDEVNELSEAFHKLFLPIAMYFSLVLFGKYHYNTAFLPIILGFTFITFFLLLVNVQAFFEYKLNEEHKTHYIYDIIKFIIFFSIADGFSNIYKEGSLSIFLLSGGIAILSFVIITMMVWRIKKIRKQTLAFNLLASLFLSFSFYITQVFGRLNSLETSLVLLFLFYLSAAIIHHKLMNTLTINVLMEYVIIIVFLLTITYGIN
jgi:hypothetical protein